MMRPGQILGLIVAGAVLVGAGLWLTSRQGGSDSAEDAQGPVLALRRQDLNAVTRLHLYKGDGSHTTLSREASRWLVTERGYPADSGQVRKLLLDLSALQVEEQKTADPALYAKLGVEDPKSFQTGSTGLDIDVNGRTLGLIVGHSYGTRSVYLRLRGQGRSVLATPQLGAGRGIPRHWLDRAPARYRSGADHPGGHNAAGRPRLHRQARGIRLCRDTDPQGPRTRRPCRGRLTGGRSGRTAAG